MWWKPSSRSNEGSAGPGGVIDRRIMPPGVVPRHLQQWVLVGIALVMVGILAFSGSPPKPRATVVPSPAAAVIDPNQQRIEEYQRRIQEQAQRLLAEQAQLQLTKDAVVTTAGNPPSFPAVVDPDQEPTTAGTRSESRDERARFADNVAFSRPVTTPTGTALLERASASVADLSEPPVSAAPVSVAQTAAPAPPPTASLRAVEPATASQAATSSRADRPSPSAAGDEPRYRLLEGTVIETVLTNRLDGTFAGPVNCLVSVPVYASDQQHLLMPAGSRVLGEARAVNTFGQSRLAVVFHRVLLPNGTHVDLNSFHGLNQVGDLGLQDQVNRHYAQIFGVSLAIGAIAGLAQAQSAVGVDATALDAYRQGAAASVSQSSARVLDRFLNIFPTVTIREGHRIKIYLSDDLALPAYRDARPMTGGRP
jgi:type IV secretory pathway VirB10-like protein